MVSTPGLYDTLKRVSRLTKRSSDLALNLRLLRLFNFLLPYPLKFLLPSLNFELALADGCYFSVVVIVEVYRDAHWSHIRERLVMLHQADAEGRAACQMAYLAFTRVA